MPRLPSFWRRSRAEAHVAPAPPGLPLDPLAADFVADPYPAWAWLREHAPVAPLATGGHVLTRHADIAAAFTDRRLGNAPSRFSALAPRNRDRHVAADLAAHIPPFLDMPDLKHPRQALSRAFFATLKAQEAPIRAHAAALAASARPGDDLIADTARPFALRAMRGFIGIEAAEPWLKDKARAFFTLFAPLSDAAKFARLNLAMEAFREALRTAEPAAPAGSLLAAMRDDPDGVDAAHRIDAAILVFADGIENIEAGAASCAAVLAANGVTGPSERHVAEALRLQTPAQMVPRVVREDFTLHGVDLKAGHPLMLALGAGNRDPAAFPDPDRFDPARDGADVLTFGRGLHNCIGRPLALLMLTALCAELAARGARPGAIPAYQPRFGHRWPAACPIAFA